MKPGNRRKEGIHLESSSSSSSDNDSDIEFSAQLNTAQPAITTVTRELSQLQLVQSSAGPTLAATSSTSSLSEEMDRAQSTMWLGTEDGCIHVYNCTDNIRIKKNKIKIQHVSAVYSIL